MSPSIAVTEADDDEDDLTPAQNIDDEGPSSHSDTGILIGSPVWSSPSAPPLFPGIVGIPYSARGIVEALVFLFVFLRIVEGSLSRY